MDHRGLTIATALASLALAVVSVALGVELVIGAGDRIGQVWVGGMVGGLGILQAFWWVRAVVKRQW